MLDAAQAYTELGREQFFEDRMRDAVVRNLDIIGEAAMRPSHAVREKTPKRPAAGLPVYATSSSTNTTPKFQELLANRND